MKVGLLADIHGNASALSAVLRSASATGIDHLLVAGDIIGYYDQPGEVIRQLDEWSWVGVRGNHEERLEARFQDDLWDEERRQYGSGLDAAARMATETRDRLVALPHPRTCEIDGYTVLLCHGTPWDIDCYVYPDARPHLRERLLAEAREFDLVVLGHTHYPMLWRGDHATVVNPGSVGQPRDSRPGACWASWSTATGVIELHREGYDNSEVIRRARRSDPDVPYLWQVLTRT